MTDDPKVKTKNRLIRIEGSVAELELPNEKIVLVDVADLELIADFAWQACNSRGKANWYACASFGGRKNHKSVRMHRLLLAALPGQQIDHINGNGLDNRRCNLRFCSQSENNQNAVKRRVKRASSLFKGVSIFRAHCVSKPWRARIHVDGREISLGYFATEIEAANAYNTAALVYFGEFARLNVMTQSVAV